MLKQVTVNFNFDPETEEVSDLTCFVDGIEKKKKTTRPTKPTQAPIMEAESIITLEPTKILFNNKCVADMKLEYQDRIVIKYQKEKNVKRPLPLIGKDLDWGEEGTGNKLTKTNTLAYRGKANTILTEYGTEFTIEPYKEGIWKLVPKNGSVELSYDQVEQQAEEAEINIFVDDDDMTEIGQMPFTL